MHPILFEIGRLHRSTPTGAAGRGVPARPAVRAGARARRAGSIRTGSWTSASGSSSARSSARSCCCSSSSCDRFAARSAASCSTSLRSGGVFYGGLIAAVVVALVVPAPPPDADVDGRPTSSRRASRSATSSAGSAACSRAAASAGRPTVPWAITFHDELRGRQRRHAARRAAPSDAALRGGRRAADPRASCSSSSARGRPFPGRTFWTLHAALRRSRGSSSSSTAAIRAAWSAVFSTSQFVSLLLVPLAIVMLVVLGRRPGPEPALAPSTRAA